MTPDFLTVLSHLIILRTWAAIDQIYEPERKNEYEKTVKWLDDAIDWIKNTQQIQTEDSHEKRHNTPE